MNQINTLIQKLSHSSISLEILSTILIFLFVFFIAFAFIFPSRRTFFSPSRKAFKRLNEHGYVLTKDGQFEHRVIVEKLIGRSLKPGEEVHHINGLKWDNRKSNLALMTKEEHRRWHQRYEWMREQDMNPSIRWQRQKLESEFGATLF
jgi:hypothetical protein